MEPVPDDAATTGSSRGRLVGVLIGAFIALLVVVLLILGLAHDDDQFKLDRAALNDNPALAPDFTLPLLAEVSPFGPAGSPVTLSSLRGRPVVLNVWASWCEPCKDEAPLLESLWNDYKGKGLVVLGLNTQDLPDKASRFIVDNGLTFPSVRDGSTKTERKFGTTQVPETFVIDPDGRVRLVPLRGQLTAPIVDDIRKHLDTVIGS